ncbi:MULTISPECIES: YceI family protein [Desulfovibrio]|uniref:Polyisoprenoid-binding protein YceI n=3 Tax=Desulfovibrio TaxID=872 RepID=A0AA94HR96_DESDE|nr:MULTISPECIES: YceI family protein [Desulfovibrio]MDY0203467.1 YceI family protein [Desulfovibrio desulfuricans]SFW28035.1 Polyisoprenoid-binding protein YceI [Desulfovibrio desulfuricans]SPD35497.1 Lipid/polyisoprenoid-binding, YceI-like [Desulfovibrio sp. G11]
MTTWKSDPDHSRLGFVVRHITITDIAGRFAEFTASAQIGKDDLSDATFSMAARVASIDTDVAARDEHLRSADFFEAGTYPEITFASSHVRMDSKGEGKISGALTIHGVTKEVTFSIQASEVVTNPMNNAPTRAFKVWGSVKRSDFGLGTSIPALIVGEEVHVAADVECSPV